MTDYNEILQIAPYSLEKAEKQKLMTERLKELAEYHYRHCTAYRNMADFMGWDFDVDSYEQLPFVPVRLFKELELKSVPEEEIFKTMTSSGTTGQQVSKIFLDKTTANNQQKTMVKIVSQFIGKSRLPMLILDSSSVLKDRKMFSARGAGILGFSIMASDRAYALDENMKLDVEGVKAFLAKHEGEQILLFGFTFMIWQHVYKELLKSGERLDLSNAVLIHGGGWKKLQNEAVSPKQFKEALHEVCGITRVHDYYGMVEQTGCIYMECECGHFHASIFSDVLARRTKDFSLCEVGEPGIIQVVSLIPESYPGFSILTEDEGVILGEDDCPCGRKGKYFKIKGRLKKAEVRGCSDTYGQ
jgi:phenylacetate-coenzyme A ligase PaaK-like adenylate-forming protein